jgi:hypothetical protein
VDHCPVDRAALPEAAGEAVPGQAAGQIGQDAGRAGRLGVAVATLGTGGRADYHRPGRICKETLSGVTESATVADGKTADPGHDAALHITDVPSAGSSR